MSRQSENMPHSLKSFWTVWKDSGHSGNMTDSLEVFGLFVKLLEGLESFVESSESFRTVLEVVGRSGRFPTNLEIC